MSQDFSQKHFKAGEEQEELREKIIGLGERSLRKSYYPELKKRLADLERFKTLLDQSNDAIFLLEIPSGQFTDFTESACRQIEYTREACASITMYDLIPDSASELNRLMSGKTESMTMVTTLIKGSGKRVPYEMDMRRVRSGDKDYVVAIARDITERKRMEESLRLTQFALEKFSDSAIWLSPKGKFVYVNEAACKRLGYSPEELTSMHIWDIDPNYGPKNYEEAWKTVKREGMLKVESEHITRDGSRFPVEISCSYIRYGNKEYMITIDRDITDRKIAEEERERLLREIDDQRRRLQTILDTLPVSLIIVDTDDRIVFANRAARTNRGGTFPDTIEDLVKAGIWWADTSKPMDIGESGLVRAVKKGETTEREIIEIRRPDSTSVILLSSSAPLYDVRGRITGAMVVSQDITEMRKLEKERDESKQQAELYLDLMSHDLTNMNQALMGYLELIETMSESGHIDRALIDNAMEVINRSSRMIEDVKKLTGLRMGIVPLKKVHLREILSAVIAKHSKVPGRPVTFNYTPGQDCAIKASELLEVAFDNLVDNAIRHSTGPVTIDIAIDRATIAGRPYCRVTVADNGPGIPPDLKKKIFLTPEEISEKNVRTGFGLYMVRTLVDYYHGRMSVEDRVPDDYAKGAKIVVWLPRDSS